MFGEGGEEGRGPLMLMLYISMYSIDIIIVDGPKSLFKLLLPFSHNNILFILLHNDYH